MTKLIWWEPEARRSSQWRGIFQELWPNIPRILALRPRVQESGPDPRLGLEGGDRQGITR